jgi:hypothetical protein
MSDATTNLVVGSAAVIGIGSVVEGQIPNMKVILASGVVVVSLSVLDNVEPKLATGFATIIFIALCAKYLPNTIEKLGFSGGGSGANIEPPAPPADPSLPAKPGGVQPAVAFTPTPPAGQATPQNSAGGTYTA